MKIKTAAAIFFLVSRDKGGLQGDKWTEYSGELDTY